MKTTIIPKSITLPPPCPIGDVPRCRWCGAPAVDVIHRECEVCGCLRPESSEPDEDIMLACSRCAYTGFAVSFETGLCRECEGRAAP